MSDERFHGLAHKALGKEATPAEQRELRELIAEKPALKKQLKQMSAEVTAVRELLPLMADIEHPRRDLPPAPMQRLQREIQAVFEPRGESPGELQELLARLEAWVGGKVGAERKHLMELIFCIRQSLAAPAGEMFADEAVLQAPLARYAAAPRRLSEATEFCASRETDEEETRKWEAEFEQRLRSLEARLDQAEQVAHQCREEIRGLIQTFSRNRAAQAERQRTGPHPTDETRE